MPSTQQDRLPDWHIQKYWDVVEEVLREIFKNNQANNIVDRLRPKIGQLPPEERDLFFHAEPLDTAADIAGRGNEDLKPLLADYRSITGRLKWGS
jgi:hypothetical protein